MTSDAKLFGLDLRGLSAELSDALRKLTQLPWLHRVLPSSRVQVLEGGSAPVAARAQGDSIEWAGDDGEALDKASHTAVLLDSEQVLQRVLMLPPMAPAALRSAIELDVQTMSPFASQDTVWSYAQSPADKGRQRIDVVITSRQQVDQALRLQSARLAADAVPEVWAPSERAPVVLPGFGEGARLRSEARRRNAILTGLGLILVLGGVLAVTPTLQLRMRALDASQQFAAQTRASAAVMSQRETLVEGGQDLGRLQERLQQQINHVQVLAVLTEALPDDAAVQRVSFRGTKLTVQGLTNNASNMVALLAKTPGFQDVRLPTAVTRVPGSGKESFVLEASINPQILGLLAPKEEPQPSEEAGANADADAKEAQ
jgi:general secretion pathway protein L